MNGIGERAVAAWPLVAAQVMLFGTAVFALFVAAPTNSDATTTSFTRLWLSLSVIGFLAAPFVLLVDSASMADTRVHDAVQFLPDVVQQTHFGRMWLCDFVLLAATVALTLIPTPHRLKAFGVASFAAMTLLITALSSHAIDHGAVAVAVYFIHESAAALWIGAVLGLWLGVRRGGLGNDWVARTAPRVSRLAEWTVIILILSGAYTASYALDRDPRRLIYAAYGRALLVKVAAAIVVLAIGGYNRFFLIPAVSRASSHKLLVRNVGLESVLLVGVLGLAALLANTPPAH